MKKLKILESWVEQFEEAEELYGEVEVLSEFISLGEANEEDVNKVLKSITNACTIHNTTINVIIST